VVLLPVLGIAAILAATAILGLGASTRPSSKQIDQEVTALLAGVPQHGVTLGSPKAPTTIQLFADLECPTVKHFVESYLPSIINAWVRTGSMKIEYRSLKTDTIKEQTFFKQEEAALAAGRQNRMWNFALTFVRQQGDHFTDYANDAFLVHIASQVPELAMARWGNDRNDPMLFRPVALGIRSARLQGMLYTPSFTISGPMSSVRHEIQSSLEKDIDALRREDLGDVPILRSAGL
jgi:protein-disulfide isomerase